VILEEGDMKFRKKPVVIDAEQWHHGKVIDGVCEASCLGTITERGGEIYNDDPHVHTLEGIMKVSDGDWIITGVLGEKYPCKPDIFKMTYEPA